jgi:hypothetical protein
MAAASAADSDAPWVGEWVPWLAGVCWGVIRHIDKEVRQEVGRRRSWSNAEGSVFKALLPAALAGAMAEPWGG